MIDILKQTPKIWSLSLALLLFWHVSLWAQEPAVETDTNDSDVSLAVRLEEYERILAEDYAVTKEDIAELETLLLIAEEGLFDELAALGRMLLLIARENYVSEEPLFTAPLMLSSYRGPTIPSIAPAATIGAGVAALGLFNLFWHLADRAYGEYVGTETSGAALTALNRVNLFDTLTLGSAIAAGGFFAGAIPLLYLRSFYYPVQEESPPEIRLEKFMDARLKLEKAINANSGLRALSGGLLSLSAAALTGFGVTGGMVAARYYEYGISNYSEDASILRGETDSFRTMSLTFAAAAGLSLAASGVVHMLTPKEANYMDRALFLNSELLALKSIGVTSPRSAEVSLLLSGLYKEREILTQKLNSSKEGRPFWIGAVAGSLGAGALGLSASGFFVSREIIAYRKYNDAYYVSDSNLLYEDVQNFRTISLITGVAGGAMLATGTLLAIIMPKQKELERRLSYVDARIKSLEELLGQ